MSRVNDRFRVSQSATDGGWGYGNFPHAGLLGHEPSSPAMTCAGLLGLGASRGVAHELVRQNNPNAVQQLPDSLEDPAIKAGLAALATTIDYPVSQKGPGHQVPIFQRAGKNYYFLWSLERVGVAYGLKTIGDKDWYAFGAEVLVANQQNNGRLAWRFCDLRG